MTKMMNSDGDDDGESFRECKEGRYSRNDNVGKGIKKIGGIITVNV